MPYTLERLACAIRNVRPHNGFIRAAWIRVNWTAQPDYAVNRFTSNRVVYL